MIRQIRHIGVKVAEEFFPTMTAREMTLYIKNNTNGRPLIGAEIGVQRATNAYNIMRLLPMAKLYLIDPYDWYEDSTEPEDLDTLRIYETALNKMKRYGPRIFFIRKTSEEAVDFVQEPLDFVYIDGNHLYDYVKKDIELYYPKLKSGGILGGHDFNATYPGVAEAVLEFARKHRLQLQGDNIDWWLVKR